MNCRAVELLTAITGNTDTPGGQRGATKLSVNYMGNFSDQSYSKTIDTPLNHPEIMEKQLGRDKHPLSRAGGRMWANANSIVGGRCHRRALSGEGRRLPVRRFHEHGQHHHGVGNPATA